MNFLAQYGLFALKAFTLVIAILVLFAGMLALGRRPKPKLEIISLNEAAADITAQMQKEIFGKKSKVKKTKPTEKPNLYVIDFHGDIKASAVEELRNEITAILALATTQDKVVIRLESPGGSVNGYGLAASQLQRIREKNIPLSVCIDKIAASGGYLMACVANEIIAAPFAIIGSIGVVAQFPNFHRLLKKNNIDVELLTAGEYKRTLTLFGENTEKGRQKFIEDLEQIHHQFREYVLANRPQLDIDKVSTGEHWLARDAQTRHLVDILQTSDDYLNQQMQHYRCFKIALPTAKNRIAKLLKPALQLIHPWS